MEERKDSINVILGNRIRELRRKNQFSQEELAYLADLHRTYIGQIERAEKNISIHNLEKIAKALKISLKELFDFEI